MNVFTKFTRRSLAKNKTRTIVTIIGIILSMALFTAVLEGGYSGIKFLLRGEIESEGAYHGILKGLDSATLDEVEKLDEIEDFATLETVGWANSDSMNEYKPYLLIKSASPDIADLLAIHLTEGRMPENEGELLIPRHYITNGGAAVSVGDTLSLEVGRRLQDGREPYEAEYPFERSGEPEQLVDTVTRAYTVVGFYERLGTSVESYTCPGYTALTVGKGSGSFSLLFTMRHPSKAADFLENQSYSVDWDSHNSLLAFYAGSEFRQLNAFMSGFVGVLLFLIAFGSISLIYNSFSISVSERTRQFGILKSVGATNKQIRGSVIYEALLLAGISIPLGMLVGCGGIGLTLYLLRDAFGAFVGTSVQMKLVVSAPLLVVSAALCLLTTVISAYIPAKRAMTIPAIDAIRQNRDVKLSKKEIKTSPLTAKLFGFEGMMAAKNFKRNRKRYRATVVSLFLSVVLFISASSFCAYLKDSVNTFNYEDTGADLYYRGSEVDAGRREELFELLSSAEGVKHASYCIQIYAHVFIDTDDLDGDFKEMLSQADPNGANYEGYLCVAFADDGYFREVCRDNGIDAERYFDPERPACLIYNKISGMDGSSGKAGTRWRSVKVLDESRLPVTATDVSIRTIDGYELESTSVSNGETEYIFYPKKTLDEFYSGLTDTLDKSEALIVKGDDIQLKVPITIDGTIKDHIIGLSSQIPAVVFPYSMIKAVYGAELGGNMIDGYYTYCEYSLQVNNHAKVFDDLVKLLDENGFESEKLIDNAEHLEKVRMAVTVVNVFAYGFIIIISLIAVANVFNTISTNILLRRREFAMLKSIGMSRKGFRRMLNFECIIYGFKGLIYGLPAAVLVTFLIYRVTTQAFDASFYVPWYSVCIAVGSVFAVVFATMLYAAHKMRRDDPAEALKNENL